MEWIVQTSCVCAPAVHFLENITIENEKLTKKTTPTVHSFIGRDAIIYLALIAHSLHSRTQLYYYYVLLCTNKDVDVFV